MRIPSRIVKQVPPALVSLLSRNQWRHPLLRRICAAGASSVKFHDSIIQSGTGKGLRFNAGGSHSGFIFGTHKPLVQEALTVFLHSGMVMFDVGANVGFYATLAAKRVSHSGKVVCFEPVPQNAKWICHNADLNAMGNIMVRSEALGALDGPATFLESAEPTWGKLELVGKEPAQYSGKINVTIRTLDGIMRDRSLPKPNFMKIDVEGAEADVLEGAKQTISATRPVLTIELHGTHVPIARALEKMAYDVKVLGERKSILECSMNANVIAVPRERKDLISLIQTFDLTIDGRSL